LGRNEEGGGADHDSWQERTWGDEEKEEEMKVYLGNLSYSINEEELRQALAPFGTVTSVAIIKDKATGQSKGFGFVEMASDGEAKAAIEGLNGKALKGRTVVVNEARPRPDSGGRPPAPRRQDGAKSSK
jgi:RNA recognition motif-containing protein